MKNETDETDKSLHGSHECEELCSCGEKHTGHICWLSRMGLFMEVQHLTDRPTVSCSNCGAKANLTHNVCYPVPLEPARPPQE